MEHSTTLFCSHTAAFPYSGSSNKSEIELCTCMQHMHSTAIDYFACHLFLATSATQYNSNTDILCKLTPNCRCSQSTSLLDDLLSPCYASASSPSGLYTINDPTACRTAKLNTVQLHLLKRTNKLRAFILSALHAGRPRHFRCLYEPAVNIQLVLVRRADSSSEFFFRFIFCLDSYH